MLARSASDAGTRLRRSKSTSSTVHRPIPEPLDPAVAQQHALAAATTAFVRAQQNTASERPERPVPNPVRTKSTSSRKSLSSQGSHFPPLSSSFRSINPSLRQQKSKVQRQSQNIVQTENFATFRPAVDTERPISAQQTIAFDENMRPNSQLNSHRRSAASSITSQQVRKARSMYYASSVQTGSPIARPPAKYLINPPPMAMETVTGLVPTRNDRPLTPLPLATSQIPVQVAPGETIDKARDKYLQTFQQRQTKHKPSLLLAPFKKRQDKSKSKERPMSAGLVSISSSRKQTSNDTTLDSLDDFGMPKQKKEKRSISGSIKDKLKRVFRRTSNTATTLPVQQIDASRNYSSYTSSHEQSHIAERSSSIPSADDGALTDVPSCTPALERVPSPFVRPASRSSNTSGSSRSLHSEQNLTHTSSRVTSWNDSSASGTLTQREIKRLTVIHEAKDSIGSDADCVSVSSTRNTLPLPGSSALTQPMQPMQLENLLDKSSTPVDPKRVFSALMKEIDASKAVQPTVTTADGSPSAESDIFESSATKELHLTSPRDIHSSESRSFCPSMSSDRPQRLGTAKSKSSSIGSFGKVLRSTIRTVTPSEHKTSTNPERAGSVRGAVRVPRPSTGTSSDSNVSEAGRHEGSGRALGSANIRLNPIADRPPAVLHEPQLSSPSPEQIERRIAKSKERWKAQLDEHASPNMHYRERSYETTRYIGQTTLTTLKPAEVSPCPEIEVGPPTMKEEQVTPIHASQKSPKSRRLLSPLSPSVYSRNTDGMSILPNDSIVSFEDARADSMAQDGGSADVMTSHSVRSYAIGTPSPQRLSDSTHSSRDWKAWLSHEVSELATSSSEDIANDASYISTTRHRRELTQIEDDSQTVMRASLDIPTPRQVLTHVSPVGKPHANKVVSCQPTKQPVSDEIAPVTPGASRAQKNVMTIKMTPVRSTNRLSSIKSKTPQSSPSVDCGTPRSSRMNERYPFIATGRRSSSYSAKLRRTSRTSTGGSSGSSSKSKTATPTSRIYADFSVPGSNRTILHEPQIRFAKSEDPTGKQKLRKENVTPKSFSKLRIGGLATPPRIQFSPGTISRPRSMQPLSSSTMSQRPSSVANYTTNQFEDLKANPLSNSSISPLRQRSKVALRPSSPEKAVSRPKSAFDLRGAKTPPVPKSSGPGTQTLSISTVTEELEPNKSTVDEEKATNRKRASYRVSAFDNETLRLLIESPWAISGAPPSPRASLEASLILHARSKPPVSAGPSTLARNKEPSPGVEERIIDALLETEVKPLDYADNGRITPGQRMAEQFLRERSMGRGSEFGGGEGVSVKEGSLRSEGRAGQGKLEREDTPAFL